MVRVKHGMEHHPSLIPRLLPSLMLHTVHKTFLNSMGHTCKAGEEPGNKAKLTSPGVQDRGYTCTYSSLVPRASHPSVCACSEAWGRGYTYINSVSLKVDRKAGRRRKAINMTSSKNLMHSNAHIKGYYNVHVGQERGGGAPSDKQFGALLWRNTT